MIALNIKLSVKLSVDQQIISSQRGLTWGLFFVKDPQSSSGEILVIGRLRVLPLTRTSTTRTRPSGPGYVCSMRPTFHCLLTVPGSITTTTSPTRKLSLRQYHLCLDPICGKYSFIHRFHTCLLSSCGLLQRFLGLNGSASTLYGTKSPPICPIRK